MKNRDNHVEKQVKMKNKEELNNKKTKDEQTLENRCPACKASISYNAKVGKWKCEYCGSEFTLEELQKSPDNASSKEKNQPKVSIDNYDGYINYRCESCGAEIITDDQTAATFCIYCGNTAILQSKLSGKFLPDKIIPFKKEKEDAIKAFKSLSKGRPLMPKSFNDEKNIEKIRGIYIPFFLYDINISGDIVMDGKTIETWTVGKTHYTKTNTFQVTRGGTMDFSNVPIDGSTRFDNAIMNTIEPFNYEDMVPYNHAYLSGFYAEKYDEEPEKLYPEVSNRALNSARSVLRDDARLYTSKIITSDSLVAKEENKSYAMLPVWMVNVKYKDKMYIFAMNGQTGEFIGNIPLDVGKVILYTAIIFTICMILSIIASYIIFIGGN